MHQRRLRLQRTRSRDTAVTRTGAGDDVQASTGCGLEQAPLALPLIAPGSVVSNPIIDAITTLTPAGDLHWTARSRPEVMQGRATFGGVPAAWCIRAMDAVAGDARRCRSMQLAFTGPVTADEADVRVEVLRTGRSATHLQVRVTQGDDVRVSAIGVYGADRPSRLTITAPHRPEIPPVAACMRVPYIEGAMPRMTRHIGFALPHARVPFTSADTSDMLGYVSLPGANTPADAALVAALVDAWWPPILPMLSAPAPASSVTWALEFPSAPGAHGADAWFVFSGGATVASDGYASCHGMLFAPDGSCAAISRQLVAVFDER